MGAFQSSFDAEPYAELSNPVNAGIQKKLQIKNRSGSFLEGNKYLIIDDISSGETTKEIHYGKRRRIAKCESITITKSSEDYLVATIKGNYSAGSKIAKDPRPVGLMLGDLEKFQTTNMAPRLYDDENGCDDPSKQIYSLSYNDSSLMGSSRMALYRDLYVPVWDYIISSQESEGEYSSRETRGKMIGMYVVGSANNVSEGHTVSVDGVPYKLIKLPNFNNFIAIGPIE